MSVLAKTSCCALFVILGLTSVGLTTLAVASDPSQEAGIAYFEKHIRPLLAQHCYQCHSQRADKSEGGLLLDRRVGWMQGGDRGPSIELDDPQGDLQVSLLIRAVRYEDPELEMPPTRKLPPSDIAHLEHWVRMGAPAPDDDSLNLAEMTTDPSDPVLGKSHWAYMPLAEREPLPLNEIEWPRTVLDQWILAGLEAQGLEPSPAAAPRDLVRRVYFQLTGLPPTFQQVDVFLGKCHATNIDQAMEELVDQLLASPRFGQRWGRHWLDLARYADSNGLDENFLFREAWRYRNWVIDSVNADLSYDRFLLEQVAGDLLPYESVQQRDRQRIAAGFLVVGPKVLLGNDEKNQRMEVADEQIDTIGRALLGQTLGCARCHNHKFDPFPTADYYALAGVFASTRVMEMRHMLGQQRLMERLVGLGEQGKDVDDAYEAYWREQPNLKSKTEKAASVLKAINENNTAALGKLRESQAEAFAERLRDATTRESLSIEDQVAAQEAWVRELTSALAHPPAIPPRAMIPSDVDEPADECVRIAGQFDDLGGKVPRGFLTVLQDAEGSEIPIDQSGRVELGQWLTDREGRAGQLAARVMVNRIWHHLMGSGIVRTVDNFGRTGESPSHPELLDHLARKFIDSDWSVKALVREIVLSRTFMQSSQYHAGNYATDPDNRSLWRSNRRRLDPESIRDAMLAVAGQMDWTPMDSSVAYLGDQATAVGANKVRRRTDMPCRSVYLPVIRNDLPELFAIFDFADPHTTTGARPNTTVPAQGLFMLNDPMVMQTAESTATRILAEVQTDDLAAKAARLFELVFNVTASDIHSDQDEQQAMQVFLAQTEERLKSEGQENAELSALTMAAQALFASSRFSILE